jgi:ABC-type phosphonate transport system ATPase subunit
MGLDTRVGDNGVLFSGGQRQRLVIARAVFRRPQLLLLQGISLAGLVMDRRLLPGDHDRRLGGVLPCKT